MRHRANTSVGPYCHLFNTVATAYNGEIVMSGQMVRMRSDGVVKTTFGLLDLQFLLPLSLLFSVVQLVGISQQVGRCPDVERANVVGHLCYLFRPDSWMNTKLLVNPASDPLLP